MTVEVVLLGGLRVTVDGTVRATWPSRRACQLVGLLALAPNHRLPTEQVMDALWSGLPPEAARANLHKAATLARQAMGSRDAVVLRGDVVALWPSAAVTTDVAAFDRAARSALATGDPAQCAAAARLHTNELLPDERYEEWTIAARERLDRLLLDLLRAAGRWADVVEIDPTDEPAQRELMREHFEAGRLHAAIRQFQHLRTVLDREVGVLPSPATVALYRQVLGTAASSSVPPPLVGREVELVRARAAVRRAAEGRPAAIFVTGPPGIGKTRLCEELVDQAAGEGWLVLRAAGREPTAAVPYWPFVEAVQAALVERPDAAEALGEAERALLARLAGLTAEATPNPVHRHAVLHLVSRVIGEARTARTILFIDDIQWLDEDSLSLAEILASSAAPSGALLVATFRPGADRAAAAAQAAVKRGLGVEIELNPLRRAETDAIVVDVLSRAAAGSELDLVWDLSGGNPFLALEVAAAIDSDPTAAVEGASRAVDSRLERLLPGTKSALLAVALIAPRFTADEFVTVAGLDPDRGLEHLADAIAAGLVARESAGYRFRHDLVLDRLTASATEADRIAAHANAADRLAAAAAPPAQVVHHLLAAGRQNEALPWLRISAADAIKVGAHADARLAIDRGLALAPRDPALLALRADAMNGLGDGGAPAAYSVAMAVAHEPERSALAIRRAKALIYAGEVAAALETLSTVGAVPLGADGQLHVTWGLAHWCAGDLDQADDAGRRAMQHAEATGSIRDFVDATMVLAMVAHERGAWPQRVTLDLLDQHLRPDFAAVVMDAHLCIAESYLYGGVPYDEVIAFAEDLHRQAAAAGSRRADAVATTLRGEVHLLMGETETAVLQLRSAAAMHRRVGVLCGEALSLQRLAEALFAEDRTNEAQLALAGALSAAQGSPVGLRHLLDRVYGTAVRNAADPLLAVEKRSLAVRGPAETCPPCSVNFMVPAAIACAGTGDIEQAQAFLAGSERVVSAFYPRGGWLAALDEARAHVALANGQVDAAAGLLTAAMHALDRLGQRLDADRCRRDLDAIATAGKV